jgi:DNA-binding protein YbaB
MHEAQKLHQMAEMQEEGRKTVEATAGGGTVTVVASGVVKYLIKISGRCESR